MRRARAYSSSCSQVILAYLHPFWRNSLLQPKIAKTSLINTYVRIQNQSWSSMLTILRNSSPEHVMLSSMSATILMLDKPTADK